MRNCWSCLIYLYLNIADYYCLYVYTFYNNFFFFLLFLILIPTTLLFFELHLHVILLTTFIYVYSYFIMESLIPDDATTSTCMFKYFISPLFLLSSYFTYQVNFDISYMLLVYPCLSTKLLL